MVQVRDIAKRDVPVITETVRRDENLVITVEQDIMLRVVVAIPSNSEDKQSACGICKKWAGIPDADALQYILDLHDGSRICFPVPDNDPRERDSYPVKGWRRITIGDNQVLACGRCVAAVTAVVDGYKNSGNIGRK